MNNSPAEQRQSQIIRQQTMMLQQLGYSNKAISLILNRTNLGAIENPSVCMTFESGCGDTLILYLNLEGEIIRDVKFQYIGCVGLQSAAAALTLLIRNCSLSAAAEFQESDIIQFLAFIPENKHDCVEFAVAALHSMLRRLESPRQTS